MIWCVEDDASILDIEVYTLQSTGFQAQGFADGGAFWSALESARELPELAPGKRAEKVICLSPGYLMSQDTDSCRFQIQLQLQYYQEGR